MSANEKSPEPQTTETLPESPDSLPVTGPPQQSDMSDLNQQLKKLLEKMDVPKRKDVWDILSVMTTFTGTVLVAGISLFLTQSYQRSEADRTRSFQEFEAERAARHNESELQIQSAQVRVEELKAITAMAPLLASSDPRMVETGRQLLRAVQESESTQAGPPISVGNSTVPAPGPPSGARSADNPPSPSRAPAPRRLSLFEEFAKIALSSELPPVERVEAFKKIGDIATGPMTSPAIKARAADIATRIAADDAAPADVQRAAAQVLARVKRMSIADAQKTIASEPINSAFNEVVLHSMGQPGSSMYKSDESIPNLAKFLLGERGYRNVAWHYAIAPDGSIWLGSPLDQAAIHARTHNKTAVSVMLILDGSKELPSRPQREALAAVLRSLLSRMHIGNDRLLFHGDFDPTRRNTCPGVLITKEMVNGWIN